MIYFLSTFTLNASSLAKMQRLCYKLQPKLHNSSHINEVENSLFVILISLISYRASQEKI